MAEIHLKHPRHGHKVASSEMEAAEDRKHGWMDFDPAEPKNEYTPELVAEADALKAANVALTEELEKVKADLKEAKADLKEAKADIKKAEAELAKAKKPPTAPGTVPDFLKPEG